FRFFSAPGPELRVRTRTPDYASDGWDAPVGIIETVMPDRAFIVDTIRSRLERAGVPVVALLHPIFAARRDPSGQLELLAEPEGAGTPRESFTHIAIPRSTDAAALARLEADVRDALEDVRLVPDRFAALPGPAPDRRQDDRRSARPPPRAHGRHRREAARPRRARGGRAALRGPLHLEGACRGGRRGAAAPPHAAPDPGRRAGGAREPRPQGHRGGLQRAPQAGALCEHARRPPRRDRDHPRRRRDRRRGGHARPARRRPAPRRPGRHAARALLGRGP